MSPLQRIVGKRIVELDGTRLSELLAAHERVVIEAGAGDGAFVRALVVNEPSTLAIGFDASVDVLVRPSRQAARRGDNPLFLRASIEAPPPELAGLAETLYVHFPWGSLLRGIVLAEELVVANLVGLLRPGGAFQFLLTYDPVRDASLALSTLSADHFDGLVTVYREYGLLISERRMATLEEISASRSSWAKRLRSNKQREVWLVRGMRA